MSQTAVIAGLGPGFGEELAWNLAEDGYDVAFIARSADYLEEFAETMRAEGHTAFAAPADATDAEELSRAFDSIRDELGAVDVLSIQFSAEAGWARLDDLSAGDFEAAWQLYGLGTFRCIEEVVDDMRESGGTILVVGTTPRYGVGDAHGFVSSNAAKRALTESVSRELGDDGVHVVHAAVDSVILNPDIVEVAPEPVETERFIDPESVADVCLSLVEQDDGCWSTSVDLRSQVDELQYHMDEVLNPNL